ncbi:MAG: hypothetical protein M1825_001644 [Sarcosagium campestre]|nr:MAG: hypothetical protein M1825_001644 [Sarcosagium campestre]
MIVSAQEQRLTHFLGDLPRLFNNRYGDLASRALLEHLFQALAGYNSNALSLFFPDGPPAKITDEWNLRKAQGAMEGSEYSPAARGKACGHIFKSGETTYRCKTCSSDDTCVLCSRCFDASDHTGHMIFVNISPGNSGCCDCGDVEAWRLPVNCAIHTLLPDHMQDVGGGVNAASSLNAELKTSIRTTIARAIDYLCDVVSCSPEQLRLPKTEGSILTDERRSRLNSKFYVDGQPQDATPEFALVLWNDEKHTVPELQEQVARACRKPKRFGLEKANQVNDLGRAIIEHDTDISRLLARSKIIEQIKITATIRSSRDTFREQMCGTIIEWLLDIAGCSVADDHDILRVTVCEEMLKTWRTGSGASNAEVGRDGIFDNEKEEAEQMNRLRIARMLPTMHLTAELLDDSDFDEENDDNEDDEQSDDDGGHGDGETRHDDDDEDDEMEIDLDAIVDESDADFDMEDAREDEIDTETSEATIAGYPPPPLPPAVPPADRQRPIEDGSSSASNAITAQQAPGALRKAPTDIPRTPSSRPTGGRPGRAPRYWVEKPAGYNSREVTLPLEEDLKKRVRLDWMILFDLRLWKKARIDLKDLYITTVVSMPKFKRIMGLRFAGLYTTLAQLYLIADREPDHSIINLSLQMLTTPSITDEVVERGNFLTNLIAILYTFLTSRQVGHPQDVQSDATLAFDAGSLTNRRMYHFFMDLRHMFSSEYVQEKLRTEDRYMLQFLDLVKLHQGITPNTRAVGDHVEYETDAWISASLITRELNRLCRQFAESFRWRRGESDAGAGRAIRLAARVSILSSLGLWRHRFHQAEIKEETSFKRIGGFEFDLDTWGRPREYSVVKFTVERQPISFHHALHYTLSWLIDCTKGMSVQQLRELLTFTGRELKEKPLSRSDALLEREPEDFLLAMFDFPLRVCAWLAQMKAGMWVRNGLSLRHQMSTYRGVSQRDVAHHRDIFLLQTALVTCDPSRVLASMIDRFGMESWMKGRYENLAGFELPQVVDVAEDFIHLMIVLLSDRTSLVPAEDEPDAQTLAMRRDIAHVLCFKPLPFSDLTARLAEKAPDMEEFQEVLDEMTRYRPPEGLVDVGTFELREEYIEEVDPYIAHYSKNQREEAENAYRKLMSKKTRKAAADIVFEPKLRRIRSGIFADLAAFTRTNLFAQVIYHSLRYPIQAKTWTPTVPSTRLETFLQVVLHLTLIAVIEDHADELGPSEASQPSFTVLALTKAALDVSASRTILSVLQDLAVAEEFRACHAKIKLILRRLQHKRPKLFASALSSLGIPLDRLDTASPAALGADDLESKETKKRQALERQAKVMAQFQQQQQNFLSNHDFDWGEDDFSDLDADPQAVAEDQPKMWRYPTGTCILCQEETNDGRLYGTFALIGDSNILRQTNVRSADFVAEAVIVPQSLDRSAEHIRPFGVSGRNRDLVKRFTPEGDEVVIERQGLGLGFPPEQVKRGPVTTGCGHIMHYACFELYYQATSRRQQNQVARCHPERLDKKEFCCPLCKALGNAFLPIVWRGREESYPAVLQNDSSFEQWLAYRIGPTVSRLQKSAEGEGQVKHSAARHQDMFAEYAAKVVIPPVTPVTPVTPVAPVAPVAEPQQRQPRDFLASIGHLHFNPVGLDPSPRRVDPSGTTPHEIVPGMELANIYRRLRDTMKNNQLFTRYVIMSAHASVSDDLTYTDTLERTLGYSISAAEIAQRGVQSEPGATLLDKMSPQSLTSLRILSETVSSYLAVGGLRGEGGNSALLEFSDTQSRQLRQLLVGHPQIFDASTIPVGPKEPGPLFNEDTFVFLCECTTCLVPSLNLDVHHVMRLCYLAEITKVVVAFSESDLERQLRSSRIGTEEVLRSREKAYSLSSLDAFRDFVKTVFGNAMDATHVTFGDARAVAPFSPRTFRILRELVGSYALVFLRKCVILMHTRYGVDFPSSGFAEMDSPEIERLSRALRLPSLDDMFRSVTYDVLSTGVTSSVVTGWIRHWAHARAGGRPMARSMPMSLSHPGIFELVGLPKNHDTLSEEAMRRKCPTTGKDQYDPSICLFCGEIMCSQAYCCQKDGPFGVTGGCNQHMAKCGRNVGLFINIRKCNILYLLHGGRGGWITAPYLDKHGEVDPGLRRNRQLFLNQRRYDALLRNVWLSHGIPSTIARKLEADIHNGGWETI